MRLPDIAVTMKGLVPTVHAQLNGKDAEFIADSGAFFSFVTPAAVAEFKLKRTDALGVVGVQDVSGAAARAIVVRANSFRLFGKPWENLEFLVVGGFPSDPDAAGLLGQNVFRIADVEYDFANGVLRLAQPTADCQHSSLAYWADAAGKPYSVVDIETATATQPKTKAKAYLNGTEITVEFDTGAPRSLLTLDAARRAGITQVSAGVSPGGPTRGVTNSRWANTWIGRFASFKLGAEEIRNAPIRFGDLSLHEADMLIGADFFLSHRVYVAGSQHKLYFTYNGGPAFDLAPTREEPAPSAEAARASAAEASQPADTAARLDEPTDAAGFARRGTASDARQSFQAAIADLTRACELAPTESGYFHERGVVYLHDSQPDKALADFDQAIKLKADDVDTLMARARLHADRHDPEAQVTADLDAADRALPKEADMRLRLASLYTELRQPSGGVRVLSPWIDAHPRDPRRSTALNSRCWYRALSGQELTQAFDDCEAALTLNPHAGGFLDSRALVELRQGSYRKAIRDYDAALRLRPKSAWSLYGRGLAKLRIGLSTEGKADVDASIAIDPKIAELAAGYGLKP